MSSKVVAIEKDFLVCEVLMSGRKRCECRKNNGVVVRGYHSAFMRVYTTYMYSILHPT
jgi:hypothetical protein